MPLREKRYPWQKRRRTLLCFVFFVLALPVAGGYLIHWHNARSLKQQLAAIHAAGYPTTIQELEQWSARPPAHQDSVQNSDQPTTSPAATAHGPTAVEGYQEVFDLIQRVEDSAVGKEINSQLNTLIKDLPKQGRFSVETHNLMEKKLAENASALQKLHEVSQRPPGRFPVSLGFGLALPHLEKLRNALRLLQMDAWIAAENGEADRTFETLLACMAVPEPLRYEPNLTSYCTMIYCHNTICNTLSRVLGASLFSDAQLARLGNALPKETDAKTFCWALAGERVVILDGYANSDLYAECTQYFPDLSFPIEKLERLIPGTSSITAPVAKSVVFSDYDRNRFLSIVNETIEAACKPVPEALPALAVIEQKTKTPTWAPRGSNLLMQGIPEIISGLARNQAQLRSACAALAVERYRLLAKQTPNSLDAVAPAFLSAVPLDPFDGKPLRYRPENASYLIYSVSANFQDDQGAEPNESNNYKWRQSGDCTFRVAH